ncbi:hypothetical protein J6590_075474 [Homalodisca vitripennis]|nr:hypothetical protein J6590_075474 [Homalodisca vitripennis]
MALFNGIRRPLIIEYNWKFLDELITLIIITLLAFFRTVRGEIARPTDEPNLTKKQASFVLQDRPRLRPNERPVARHRILPHSKKGA